MAIRKLDKVALAYAANVKRLRTEGRIILDSVMNEAIGEMTDRFNEALARGELLTVEGTREELGRYLLQAARKELGDAGHE